MVKPHQNTSEAITKNPDITIIDGKKCMTVEETVMIGRKAESVDAMRREVGEEWVAG